MARLMKRPVTLRTEITDDEGTFEVVAIQLTEGDKEALSTRSVEFIQSDSGFVDSYRTISNGRRDERQLAYYGLSKVVNFFDPDTQKEVFTSSVRSGVERVRHAMSESAFAEAWGFLSADAMEKIMQVVYEINPSFDPERRSK